MNPELTIVLIIALIWVIIVYVFDDSDDEY